MAGLLVCALSALTGSAALGASTRLAGSTTPLPPDAKVLGHASSSTQVSFTVALQPRDPAGLAAFATAVSTPGNPAYGRFLTSAQFARRFGAPRGHIAAVVSLLQADGFSVGQVKASQLTIPVTGTAAQVEHAFSVRMARVRTASGRIAYANDQPAAVPSSIAQFVQGVIGLNNVTLPQPAGLAKPVPGQRLVGGHVRPHVPTGGPQPCAQASAQTTGGGAGAHGLTADQVATAYSFPSIYGAGNLGAGQNVAVLEIGPTLQSDISQFQGCYGISSPVNFINVGGGPGPYVQGTSDDGEPTLDIDIINEMAPKATVDVYQGNPNSASLLVDVESAAISANKDKVISSSLGICEAKAGGSAVTAENTLLQQASSQGQSFFDSSGDSGSTMCHQVNPADNSLSVIDPGAQPFATGVGGTTLFTLQHSGVCPPNPNCYWQPGDSPVEGVWNDGAPGGKPSGTGGGISTQWTMPSYQSGAPNALGVVNSNSSAQPCAGKTFCREVPDVSANADPNTGYVVFSNGAFTVTGGTSASAPLWGALAALANSSSTCRGFSLGFMNPALYQLAGSSYLSNFMDPQRASPFTNLANNDALQVNNGLFPITSAYDMTTGIGSPIANALISSLCALRAPVYTVSVTNPGTQQGVVGNAFSLQVAASDSGSQSLTLTATGLPAGLGMTSSGLISGTPTAAGSSTVTVSASDQFTNQGSTSFTINVVAPGPPTIGGRAGGTGLKNGKPTIKFGASAGSNAPGLKAIVVILPNGLSFASKNKSLRKGLSVSGGASFTRNGPRKGTIVLSNPSGSVTVTIKSPAISESSGLKRKAKKRGFKGVSVTVIVADAALKTTGFTLKVK